MVSLPETINPAGNFLSNLVFKFVRSLGVLRQHSAHWWTEVLIPGWRKIFSLRISKGNILEIAVILLWALFVGRAYLNFDLLAWPIGNEFASSVQTHYVWTLLPECGTCIFWNGFVKGGAPAFAEMHGSLLYPLIPVVTLIWGVLNGTKLVLIFSLFMAGIAQWWLIRVLGMGRAARLWCACMAVVGGHLAGKMELGAFGVVLSMAACSLVIAPGLALARTAKRRYAILLAITLALAILSGQGYIQVGLVLGIFPAFLVLFPGNPRQRSLLKEFMLAGILAVLLAGVLLVPLLHFYPNIYKNVDPEFSIAQPLEFIPLNLVINDLPFYQSDILKPAPFPHLYANFLGWVPVLLAILALRFVPRSQFRLLLFFLVGIGLVFLTASGFTLKLVENFFPPAAGVRHSPQIAGLAIPLILALSGWGLEGLLRINWPKIALIRGNLDTTRPWFAVDTVVFLFIPLAFGLFQAYEFGQYWLVTTYVEPQIYQTVQLLKTDSSQWVNLPFGEHFWVIPGIEAGLKLGIGIRTWDWKDRENPPLNREGTREDVDKISPDFIQTFWGINVVSHPENEYAYIQAGDQKIPCKAQSRGGNIDVTCPDAPAGQLVVQEYYWSGWYAWRDQTPATQLPSKWLSVNAPEGQHYYSFRYWPLDVWLGLLASLIGAVACIILWRKSAPLSDPN